MTAISFVPMTPELFVRLEVPAGFPGENLSQAPDLSEKLCRQPHVAFALMEGDEIIGAGGLAMMDGSLQAGPGFAAGWTGRAYAWMQPGATMTKRHFAHAFARCRFEIVLAMRHAKVRRVECACRCGHPERVRWAQRLGFNWEATMHGFGPDGVDYELYALTEEPLP